MLRRLIGDLPAWARPEHPLLRYELQRIHPRVTWSARASRIVVSALGITGLLFIGYLFATDLLRQPPGINQTEALWRILYLPLLILQVLMVVLASIVASSAVDGDRRRQTWDHLRATEVGAAMALRTRWAAVFYRLRGWFALLYLGRVLLIGAILWDLTTQRGGYLDVLTANSAPAVPLFAGVILLSAIMTASLLVPLTSVGWDAAVGLLISARCRQRVYAVILQMLYLLVRLGTMIALIVMTHQYLLGAFELEGAPVWGLLWANGFMGDGGLTYLQLSLLGEIWALVANAIFIGVALLLAVGLQAVAADALLWLAVRTGEITE